MDSLIITVYESFCNYYGGICVKVIGELKEKLMKADTIEEKIKILSSVGIELTEEELDLISGGVYDNPDGVPVNNGLEIPAGQNLTSLRT